MTRRFHNSSIFGPGRRVPLDREQKAQFLARLGLQRRPGRLTIATVEVGRVLANMLGADGRLDPSQEHIAKRANVQLSTVKRALAQLRKCGFLDWTRRLVRAGWRCAQTSNAYVLRVPACEVHSERRVVQIERKKERKRCSGEMTDVEAFANRDRQLVALGFSPM
jgi:DNA-binding IclR family transcriptional regulator